MFDQRDGKGQWPYLSMAGSQLSTDFSVSLSRLNKLKKFPIYLLETSNQTIGIIPERVINSLPPRNRDTLSSVFQLQQVEIVLQKALHSQKGKITARLRENVRTSYSYHNSFLVFKKRIAIAYCLWERTFQKLKDQTSIEWTRHLIDCQIVANSKHNQGQLQKELFNALLHMVRKNNRGSPNLPIDFMDRIKAVFEDEGLIMVRDNHKHYFETIDGSKTAWMKHQQFLEIRSSISAEQSDRAKILKGYDSWDFSKLSRCQQASIWTTNSHWIECRPIDARLRS